jgi:hypothetical protein
MTVYLLKATSRECKPEYKGVESKHNIKESILIYIRHFSAFHPSKPYGPSFIQENITFMGRDGRNQIQNKISF